MAATTVRELVGFAPVHVPRARPTDRLPVVRFDQWLRASAHSATHAWLRALTVARPHAWAFAEDDPESWRYGLWYAQQMAHLTALVRADGIPVCHSEDTWFRCEGDLSDYVGAELIGMALHLTRNYMRHILPSLDVSESAHMATAVPPHGTDVRVLLFVLDAAAETERKWLDIDTRVNWRTMIEAAQALVRAASLWLHGVALGTRVSTRLRWSVLRAAQRCVAKVGEAEYTSLCAVATFPFAARLNADVDALTVGFSDLLCARGVVSSTDRADATPAALLAKYEWTNPMPVALAPLVTCALGGDALAPTSVALVLDLV